MARLKQLELLNIDMIFPQSSDRVKIRFNEDYVFTNKRGKSWTLKAGWESDGHSIPGPFKNFDRVTFAALCHDQDCERCITYKGRTQADKDYYDNMRDLGASRFVAGRRYTAVRARTTRLKMVGKLT